MILPEAIVRLRPRSGPRRARPRRKSEVPDPRPQPTEPREAKERYVLDMVRNLHEREIAAPAEAVGMLIDSLAGENDRLWPRREWPAMRLDGPLRVGAAGGHGPVRYFVTHYEPRRRVEFEFTSPAGFNGGHSFAAISRTENSTLLRHELAMSITGTAVFTWPLFFRPLHDALVEECLDRAEHECGASSDLRHRRSLWTRILRALFSPRMAERRNAR